MLDRETLEKYEQNLYRLFLNSRKRDRLSGAYILYGPKNAPLRDLALYLAKSLGCEKSELACNECDSCKRFEEGIRPDFILIDGQDDMIKKGEIQELEKKFSLSAYEKGHRLSYVINHVENINNEAANALLKFLEEPKVGQVAFLTTNNLERVLPTILSRSLSVRVFPIEIKKLKEDLLQQEFHFHEEGKKKDTIVHLSCMQAYILSENFATLEEIKDKIQNERMILDGISAGEAFLNDYCSNYPASCYTLLKETTILKESKCYNWMYLTILNLFEKTLVDYPEEDFPFQDLIHDLKKHQEEIGKGIDTIKEILTHKNLNYNATLSCARFLRSLDEKG